MFQLIDENVIRGYNLPGAQNIQNRTIDYVSFLCGLQQVLKGLDKGKVILAPIGSQLSGLTIKRDDTFDIDNLKVKESSSDQLKNEFGVEDLSQVLGSDFDYIAIFNGEVANVNFLNDLSKIVSAYSLEEFGVLANSPIVNGIDYYLTNINSERSSYYHVASNLLYPFIGDRSLYNNIRKALQVRQNKEDGGETKIGVDNFRKTIDTCCYMELGGVTFDYDKDGKHKVNQKSLENNFSKTFDKIITRLGFIKEDGEPDLDKFTDLCYQRRAFRVRKAEELFYG